MTVLMRALDEHPLTDEVYEEVRYLIKDRGANPNLCDKQGRNAVSEWEQNMLILPLLLFYSVYLRILWIKS